MERVPTWLSGAATAAALLWACTANAALTVGPYDVYVRIVDVGGGLCAIIKTPGGQNVVYDAGHWNGGKSVDAARSSTTVASTPIVISHSDCDHLRDAAEIIDKFPIHWLVSTGFRCDDTATWTAMNEAVERR